MNQLSVLFIICVYFKIVESLYCYWNTGCPYKYFGSKTPYNAVRGDIRDSLIKIKGCEPVSFWGIHRHGKRYPGIYFGNQMKAAVNFRDYVITSYEKGKSSLCAQDVENLRNWPVNNEMFENPHQLTAEGYQELKELTRRLKRAFPKLFTNLTTGSYSIRPAFGKKLVDSAKAFSDGLEQNLILEKANEDFDLIAPYATCGKYQRDVIQNPNIYEEAIKFTSTPEYLVVKDRIQRRTGIEFNLTDHNVTALYDLCRYTWSSIANQVSPWCALFTSDDLQVMEYIDDLRHYYRNAYGFALNEKFGHFPLADLLKHFREIKEGKGKKLTAYITHASMIDMVFTSLGLFKDENILTGAQRNPKRKWRSSKLSIFSTNLVAILNRCTNDNSNYDYNVVFYQNEEPLRNICKEGICTWQEFDNILKPFLNTTSDFCEFTTKPLQFIR